MLTAEFGILGVQRYLFIGQKRDVEGALSADLFGAMSSLPGQTQ
jgi:hypothetical protein